MAGMGKRMRPHTLTIPKPLIPIAGKPIVHRLVEDIAKVTNEKIEEIAFITGRFGEEVESQLIAIAESIGAKGRIFYQDEALGTAHAVLCAQEIIEGKVIVAFADTLFKANFKLESENDSIIWVHRVDNPSAFGVVKVNANGLITDFIEKPKEFVSDLAIIGIYYFKDGNNLKKELQYLIDNNIQKGGEYQLTDALENMKNKEMKFSIGKVEEWLDCGNKNATVYTNQRILEFNKNEFLVSKTARITNSLIIEPCYIADNVELKNSIIGPHVSIGENSIIKHSIVTNSMIQTNSLIENANIDNSMIGNYVDYHGKVIDVSVGDFTSISLNKSIEN